jgi:hypothetical protein
MLDFLQVVVAFPRCGRSSREERVVSPPAASPLTSPADSSRIGGLRWSAASALLAGGALAFMATFVPLGRATYPAASGEPASTSLSIPGQDLATAVRVNLRAPNGGIIGTLFWAFALWGVPLYLAALGGALLLIRRWTPAPRVWAVALILVELGAGFTIVSMWGYLNPIFGSQGATRALEYGPGVSLIGYLCALAGTIGLPFLARRSRR